MLVETLRKHGRNSPPRRSVPASPESRLPTTPPVKSSRMDSSSKAPTSPASPLQPSTLGSLICPSKSPIPSAKPSATLTTIAAARSDTTTTSAYAPLTGFSFSNATPPQGFAWNHLGQMVSATDASGTHSFSDNVILIPMNYLYK
mgnify:CR=1 FL=1